MALSYHGHCKGKLSRKLQKDFVTLNDHLVKQQVKFSAHG